MQGSTKNGSAAEDGSKPRKVLSGCLRQILSGVIPVLLSVFLLLSNQLSPFAISKAAAANLRDSGNLQALVTGNLGDGRLMSTLLPDAPGIGSDEIAIKLADVSFKNKRGGEPLSVAEAYGALLHAGTTVAELESKAGRGGFISQDIEEEILAQVADTAARERDLSQSEAAGIMAGVMARHRREGVRTASVTGDQKSPLLEVTAEGPKGQEITIPPENIHFQVGSVVMVIDPPRSFTPGLYHGKIRISNPITGETKEFNQDFTWGVLAMNTDQDVYRAGQTADVQIGVLDESGEIVGDAQVILQVAAPDGSIKNLNVPPTGTCGVKQVGFIEPDYRIAYTFDRPGDYAFNLTAKTRNGLHSVSSTVEVVDDAPFIVTRVSATRNYPLGPTPMNLDVEFNQDFSGSITDSVPGDFEISGLVPDATIKTAESGDVKSIVWSGDFKSGQIAHFSYDYDAPDISPEFYTIGPVEVGNSWERRAWQIANDMAPSLIYGGGPTGWIYSTDVPSGNSTQLTQSPYRLADPYGVINALAANVDNGLCYYGYGKVMYYWNPAEGTGSTSHHVLADLSGVFPSNVGSLEGGGGAYFQGKLYLGPEYLSDGVFGQPWITGDMYDIYECTLAADGKSIVSSVRLNITTLTSPRRPLDFGSFGDILVKANGASGMMYGSTGMFSSFGLFWSFNLSTSVFTRINTAPVWEVFQLGETISGEVWAGNALTSQIQKIDPATGNLLGSPVAIPYAPRDLSTPYNARIGTTDISLTKSISNPTPNVGQTVTFTLPVTNSGPDTAYNISVQDVIPNGYSYVAGSIGGGSARSDAGAPTLTWTVNSLNTGSSVNLTFQAVVNASGNYLNTSQVMACDQYDPDSTPGNGVTTEDDWASATCTPQRADLSLTKVVSNPNPNVGNTVTFTLTLSNGGPNTATNISVQDIIPNGYSYVAGSIGGGSSRSDAGAPTLTWTVNSLNTGSSVNLTFQAVVNASGNYLNTSQVMACDQYDPDSTPGNSVTTEDDWASATCTPQRADLSLTKVVSNPNPNVGNTVTFTLTLSNGGPDTATNV